MRIGRFGLPSLFTMLLFFGSVIGSQSFAAEVKIDVLNQLPRTFMTNTQDLQVHITGESGFKKKLEILDRVKSGSTVDMAYFIFEDDYSTSYLIHKMLTLSQTKNIKFRILVDQFMSEGFRPLLSFLSAQKAILVRQFGAPKADFRKFLLESLKMTAADAFLKALALKDAQALSKAALTSPILRSLTEKSKVLEMLAKDKASAQKISPEILVASLLPELTKQNAKLSAGLEYHLIFYTQRMHHKILIASTNLGTEFINGGRNISDEYHLSFGNSLLANRNYPFFDTEVSGVLKDKVAIDSLAKSFDKLWNHALTIPVLADVAAASLLKALDEKAAVFAAQFPASKNMESSIEVGNVRTTYIENTLGKSSQDKATAAKDINETWRFLIGQAKHKIEIISAYFYLTPEMLSALKQALNRDVQVTIYTNSFTSTDMNIVNIAAYAALHKWRSDLPKMEIYELRKGPKEGSLHAKIMNVDDTYVAIGSANFDPRTQYLDSNNMLVLDLNGKSDVAQKISAAYKSAGILKLDWDLLVDAKARVILEKSIQEKPYLKNLLGVEQVLNQL